MIIRRWTMFYLKTENNQLLVTNSMDNIKVPTQILTLDEYNQELEKIMIKFKEDEEERAILDLVEKGYTIYK